MKTPKMPSPQKQVMPTAPEVNASGLINKQNEKRRQQGIFSTLMGSNTATGNRLRSYLEGANTSTTVYNQNNSPSTRTRSGMQVKN